MLATSSEDAGRLHEAIGYLLESPVEEAVLEVSFGLRFILCLLLPNLDGPALLKLTLLV